MKDKETDSNESSQCRFKNYIFTGINFLNHAMIVFLTGYIIYLSCDHLSDTVNLHVFCCTVGVSILIKLNSNACF